jgi:hypothetical protein
MSFPIVPAEYSGPLETLVHPMEKHDTDSFKAACAFVHEFPDIDGRVACSQPTSLGAYSRLFDCGFF